MKDKKFRIPRVWSNRELEKFAHFFEGNVVNVSGWKDIDKEGRTYRSYFCNSKEYWITNYKSELKGFQGDQENEIFLDLSLPLESGHPIFDVVFNHTVLEHIFEVDIAFSNLCRFSKDIVILVVPFLQEQHADYGDYWRFTPQAIDKLFQKNDMTTIYLNYNDNANSSIYVFAIGSKIPEKWDTIRMDSENKLNVIYSSKGFIGTKIITKTFTEKVLQALRFISGR